MLLIINVTQANISQGRYSSGLYWLQGEHFLVLSNIYKPLTSTSTYTGSVSPIVM